MSKNSPIQTVLSFHERLNSKDIDGLIDLASEDVTVGGPRGSGSGKDLLREWFGRANITMTPIRWFGDANVVVVEQTATWLDAAGDPSSNQIVASVFRLNDDGLISGVARYGDIGEALTSNGLDADNSIPDPA